MMGENGEQLSSVPPGFRFHPTEEELLCYYLRKKVSYEAIELDVIREVDLNKLEPWDLKDKCRIGSGHQNEWYFFSHKDKKYPTGSRTNRATSAGFWKATGRDKAIHMANSNSKRIGMRKTLVFYTGRAPHGQKTDWIMHEYRLQLDDNPEALQEDGWVVCRVFKKKSHKPEQLDYYNYAHTKKAPLLAGSSSNTTSAEPYNNDYSFDACMQLPQLLSPDQSSVPCPSQLSLNAAAADQCPRLTCGGLVQQDCSFLNRLLLASDHLIPSMGHPADSRNFSFPLFPYPYPYPYPHPHLGSAADFFKFSKLG